MTIYAESSGVLAWLLGEDAAPRVREVLRKAELVIASDLTLLECDRVLVRAVALGEIEGSRCRQARPSERSGGALARAATERGHR